MELGIESGSDSGAAGVRSRIVTVIEQVIGWDSDSGGNVWSGSIVLKVS